MGAHMQPGELGHTALASPQALQSWFLKWQRSQAQGPGSSPR